MTALLAQASWPLLSKRPLVLVPLGSTEQHGPHLPFETDAVIATAVASAAVDTLEAADVPALLAPTQPYGASGEHQDFPGTVSIGNDALRLVLVELVRSLSTWAGRIVFVNGHGGNVPTLASAIPQMVGENHDVSWVPCVPFVGDAHAGRTETSVLLSLAPETVRLDAAAPGATAPIAELFPRLVSDGVRAISPNGVLGDPTGANAEEGQQLLTQMIDGVIRRILAATPDASGCLRDPFADLLS